MRIYKPDEEFELNVEGFVAELFEEADDDSRSFCDKFLTRTICGNRIIYMQHICKYRGKWKYLLFG